MFERFTDRACRVVVLAQEEARMLNHNYIGTEHVLLGLLHEGEGIAPRALESLGISLEGVRSQVEEIIGQGQQALSGHIPFTPRAKKIMELSLREALQLGHNYIGTEHILLGLIREGEGVAAQVLVKLGAELTRVRQRVIQLLNHPIPTPEPGEDDPLRQKINKLADEIVAMRTLKEKAIDDGDFDKAAAYRDQITQAMGQLKNLEQEAAGQSPEAAIKDLYVAVLDLQTQIDALQGAAAGLLDRVGKMIKVPMSRHGKAEDAAD